MCKGLSVGMRCQMNEIIWYSIQRMTYFKIFLINWKLQSMVILSFNQINNEHYVVFIKTVIWLIRNSIYTHPNCRD